MLYSNTLCVHSIFVVAFPIILFCHAVLIYVCMCVYVSVCVCMCVYVCVCVCGYTCFKTSKVAHVTITFCIGDDQSSVSSSTALARRASAHFSAFSLPRTALWWTPALSGSYSSPILSTRSTTCSRHPWGPTGITCKPIVQHT